MDVHFIISFNDKYVERLKSTIKTIENEFDYDVYPKNHLGSAKEQHKSIQETIKRVIEYNDFCEGIGVNFKNDSIRDADAIILMEEVKIRNRRICGFCAVNFKKDYIYLDLICANAQIRGSGTIMLENLDKIANALSLTEIKLSSVTNALAFYMKKEFECDDLCPMKRPVTPRVTKRRTQSLSKEKSIKKKKTPKKKKKKQKKSKKNTSS
jgi:hypothetical protein